MATLAKSVAGMLPRWTNREVIESSGRDPLGLSRASDILIEYLLPGIISTTSRARYYSFYPWLIRDVALVSAEGKSRSFRQEFMSHDTAFGVSSYLGRVDKAPVVGSDAITLRHAEFQAEGQVNTKFKLLPSNDYGGLDQYYASSLHEVGLISPTATTERWELTPAGQMIAVAFEKSISDTPYFRRRLNRATEIDFEHLKESSASFSLDGLRRSEAAEERRLLIEALFNPDKIAQHGARLRQETLGQMLHVMAQTGAIRDHQLDFDILYCPHYFGSIEINGKQRVYRPIAKWATTHALWRQFCAHQYLTAALEILLEAILNVLGGQPEGLSREILADTLAASEVIEQLASYCGASCAQPSKFARAFGVRGIPTPEDCERNLKEWSVGSFRSEAAVLDAYGDGKMSRTATAIAVSMVLYGKWRASVDSSFVDLVSRFATELWLGNYLTVLDKWLTSSSTWHDAFKELIELIFARHETVMFQKRRLEACWMSFSNQRYFKEQDFRHTWRSSRHSNALQICYDLGLADFEPDDETWRLSRAGSKLLDLNMSKSQAKLNLPDLLRMKSYRHALIATFAFSPRFFEEIALERFRVFKDNGNISVVIDRSVYEDLITRDPDNRENFPKKANIRYLLHPISTPGNFHAKIFLFANKDRGLLIIGSANLTRDGLSSNAELCAVFEFDKEENTGFHRLFQDVIGYFWKLQEYAPSNEFESNLRELEREALWIQESGPETTGAPSFLHNFDRSLWDQLREAMRGRPKHLHVVSRYFDATPTLLDDVAREFSCKQITISTQNGITTLSRPWLAHPSVKKGSTRLRLCRYSDSGQNQPLHAKAYVLETDKEILLAIGSANFTTAALRRTVGNGNEEILLLYRLPVNAIDPLRFFDPDQSAVALKSATQLITAPPRELSRTGNSFAYILDSISVDGSALIVRARLPHVVLVECVIEQIDKRPIRIPLPAQTVSPVRFTVHESIVSQLRESTAVGWLEFLEHEQKRRSNEVLIANLQDLVTGRNIRRERQIAEARESPARFISLLNELCREGDEERLKQFLTFCDIPLDPHVRGMRHHSRSVDLTNQTHEMRDVGARNIRYFTSIYEAVLHFVERHRRRLQRHIESGTADGIPNFAHILLTVANLLVNQIERLIAGFEANSVVKLKAGEWKEIRDQLASYYEILEKLLHMTASDYVSALLRAYPRQKVREGLVDHLKEIRVTWAKALFLRDRLNELRITRVEVEGGLGGVVRAPSFFKSVLADENWTQFAANVSALQREMSQKLAA